MSPYRSTGGFLLLLVGLAGAEPAPARASDTVQCEDSDALAVFSSPREPWPNRELRVVAVSDQRLEATLVVVDPQGRTASQATERRGGPPYWWSTTVVPERTGTYRAVLKAKKKPVACRTIDVGGASDDEQGTAASMWPVLRGWSRASENLFSAWVAHLFDDPLDAEPAWPTLHDVTRDPTRNFLHEHLGLGEDGPRGLRLEPDCADLPYFLRAYFAWKVGLPFGYSECEGGGAGLPPRCGRWRSTLDVGAARGSDLGRMQTLLAREIADSVQSTAGRTVGLDDRSDFYPTQLTRETLRPGTVYADPYGHILLVVALVPQTEGRGGILLAVDAQPDGTVARKRFWRGTFLFAQASALGSAGFKHFRPIAPVDGTWRPLDNDEIARDPDYGDFSLEQDVLGVEEFYDRVDATLSPEPQDPARVLRATIEALDEQVRARVLSVANGEDFVHRQPGVIPMPKGAAIFQTSGRWEDYATPARDLRLLIGIDVVLAFPTKVAAQPDRFVLPKGRAPDRVRVELETLLAAEVSSRRFDYTRSDGSSRTLSLTEVIERAPALEMAYNPNDCVEMRWGAAPGSEEAATCRRRAPAEQLERMERSRVWFSERRRPRR